MFDVAEGGIVEPIEFRKDQLTPDKSIIVMDEDNQKVWLWHGKGRGLVPRRTALRQAQSLKGHGYQAGNAIIGRDLDAIIEIDDRKVGREPESTQNNEKLMLLLNKNFEGIGNFVYIIGKGGEKPAPAQKSQPVIKQVTPTPIASKPKAQEPEHPKLDTPKINVNVLNEELAKTEQTPSKPALDDSDKLLIGKAIVILMDQFKDLLISSKDDGTIKIEQMEGNICSFSVDNHKISFTPDSFSEIPSEKKEAIETQILKI
nr:hypothetical protein DSAG12_02234 [Candidatus Prometheoarchaeum syntrophicum]